ncbi:MAG: PIN domain-containing protein [Methanoregula sp.]|jgi:predicted nucleic acid-binding protein|uniref:PIN domain-containing protein n=1 Tax=Methanoregula sp. TaxID=2052170 RepID=UPI0025D035A8|nr:PIN domain-containing protein [Methanoregula sp.]MCK9632420.1 PIN domain-containing protein [Methanoregula sp.]
MKASLFLDTTIFFQGIESPQTATILEHALNMDYQIRTSISVLGEALAQMHEHSNAIDYITYLNQALDDWNVAIHFPNDYVRILCYQMGEVEIDSRMIREPTDRTHLAYAMAYASDYFLTSDKNLIRYRVPAVLENAGFFKPDTMPLEKFRDGILKKN